MEDNESLPSGVPLPMAYRMLWEMSGETGTDTREFKGNDLVHALADNLGIARGPAERLVWGMVRQPGWLELVSGFRQIRLLKKPDEVMVNSAKPDPAPAVGPETSAKGTNLPTSDQAWRYLLVKKARKTPEGLLVSHPLAPLSGKFDLTVSQASEVLERLAEEGRFVWIERPRSGRLIEPEAPAPPPPPDPQPEPEGEEDMAVIAKDQRRRVLYLLPEEGQVVAQFLAPALVACHFDGKWKPQAAEFVAATDRLGGHRRQAVLAVLLDAGIIRRSTREGVDGYRLSLAPDRIKTVPLDERRVTRVDPALEALRQQIMAEFAPDDGPNLAAKFKEWLSARLPEGARVQSLYQRFVGYRPSYGPNNGFGTIFTEGKARRFWVSVPGLEAYEILMKRPAPPPPVQETTLETVSPQPEADVVVVADPVPEPEGEPEPEPDPEAKPDAPAPPAPSAPERAPDSSLRERLTAELARLDGLLPEQEAAVIQARTELEQREAEAKRTRARREGILYLLEEHEKLVEKMKQKLET